MCRNDHRSSAGCTRATRPGGASGGAVEAHPDDLGVEQIIIQTINGLVNGMVLAVVASGLTLIFGIMDIVNFAHGDLMMLGAFVGATVLGITGNFWLALFAAAIVIAMLGVLLQVTTLRPLIGRDPLTTILATFGISLVLQKYALWQ